jgi:hypothetical protein
MEDYVAKDQRTLERCREDVANSDIYVGIFAWRYGFVPAQNNPENQSITELECREALKSNHVTTLLFLLDRQVPWPPTMMDSATGDNEAGTRIVRLREELQERSAALFRSPEDLATQVLAAVYQDESSKRVKKIRLFDDAQCLSLETSALPDIDGMIREAKMADVVQLCLGEGREWWTTRLHLTAALASDYTAIQQIVFVDHDGCLLGMYSPDQVRHALARAFPITEIAYLQSLHSAGEGGPARPNDLVLSVGPKLRELCDGKQECDIKEWVTAESLRCWMAHVQDADRVVLTDQPLILLQHQIISCRSSFVALVEGHKLARVLDRNAMLMRLARTLLEEQLN